jgi:hypothetical protein
MAEMSVIWLRVAAALYSVGLLHAILTLVRKREHLFRVSLTAISIGACCTASPSWKRGCS